MENDDSGIRVPLQLIHNQIHDRLGSGSDSVEEVLPLAQLPGKFLGINRSPDLCALIRANR
jgi:hypothetical protein